MAGDTYKEQPTAEAFTAHGGQQGAEERHNILSGSKPIREPIGDLFDPSTNDQGSLGW